MMKSYGTIVMPPDNIDYKFVDPAMRNLIKKINMKSWVKTWGCCGGPASHRVNSHKFYIICEVFKQNGVYNLAKWLGRAHEFGYKAKYENNTLSDSALYWAVLTYPNLLHKDKWAGANFGKDWFQFYLKLNYMYRPNRKATLGSIFCLENTI